MQIFTPFVGANPTGAGQEELNPIHQSHPLDLGFPCGENTTMIRQRGQGGFGRAGRVLQMDDFHRLSSGEISGAGGGEGNLRHSKGR